MLIRNARRLGDGARVDLRLEGSAITQIAERLEPTPADDEVLDAAGALAIPGLWDQHIHAGQLAQASARLDTSAARSVEQTLAIVRIELARRAAGSAHSPVVAALSAHPASLPQQPALIGFGHHVDVGPEPTVAALDEVVGDLPTVLIGADAHSAWMSTAALRAFGMPDRVGIVAEEDWFALAPHLERLPGIAAIAEQGLSHWQEAAITRGTVGVVDMEWGCAWRRWTPERTRLRVRPAVYPTDLPQAPGPTGTVLDEAGLVTMGPLKIILDGALGSRTAYCQDAYHGAHGDGASGLLNVTGDLLEDLLSAASRQGLAPAIHAIGDAAASLAITALERHGLPGRIEHAQMLTDADLERLAAAGLTASMQPLHLADDRDVTEEVWGDRSHEAFRLRDLLDAGAGLVLGSDAPVAPLDPFAAMAMAVHRSGDDRPAWHPGQQIQPREALAASTDGIRDLTVGGRADVVLVDAGYELFADVPCGADGLLDEAAARRAAERLRSAAVTATVIAGGRAL